MTVNEYFGKLVKQAREEKGWSQLELADELDIDIRTLKKLEAGNGSPAFDKLAAYIFLLDISANIAFNDELTEVGVKMDHIFRELLTLQPEHIEKVCDSALYVRKWKDNHPEIETLEDYWEFMKNVNLDPK